MSAGDRPPGGGDGIRPVGLGVPRYFENRVGWAMDLHRNPYRFETIDDRPRWEGDVSDLRDRLAVEGMLRRPELVTVYGVLFPSILLFPAYWERERDAGREWAAWRDELQEWLFFGFEQWGPSWDVNASDASAPLLGQIGRGDELESMLIVFEGQMARDARAAIGHDAAAEVAVTGLLTHKRQLAATATPSREYGTHFDYGLLVSDPEAGHQVVGRGKPDTYSAYLWQCWAPAAWIQDPAEPRVDECFFAWEHTDVTKPMAVTYNLASLEYKAAYLRDRYGDLLLLQNSSPLVPGQPRFPTETFRSLLHFEAEQES